MKKSFTEKQKQEIQARFSHVLRSYRHSENLTQSELADKTGFTLPYIAKLENKKATNNKVITSIEFLEKFAKFCGGMSLSSFVSFLKDGGFTKSGNEWDDVKTYIFAKIRSNLIYKALKYFKSNKNNIEKINDDLTTMLYFAELSEKDKNLVKLLIDRMRKK